MQTILYPNNRAELEELLNEKKKDVKLLKGNIYDIGASFDIETTQINNEDEHNAYMYIWQFAIDDIVVYGRTWGAFKGFYALLCRVLMLGKPIDKNRRKSPRFRLICLVHNLSFEFQFIKNILPWQVKKVGTEYYPNIFAKDARNIVTAVTKHNLEFRCTLNLTGKSLFKLAKDYNLESQKKVGQLDYSKPRNSQTPLNDSELEYCFYDVIILSEFFHKYYAPTYLSDNAKLPTTKTSIIRNELKQHFTDLNAEYPQGFPETVKMYKWLMDWVFRGGYVHANVQYTSIELNENIFSYDFKSSYPARMILNSFPYEFIEISHAELKKALKNIDNLYQNTAYIFTLKFKNIRSKYTHSLESKHKCISLVNEYVDNGRIAKADEMIVSLTELDYLNYKDCYIWDGDPEIIGACFKSEKKQLPVYLLDLVCKYYYIKSTIDSDLNPIDYMLSKENVNGFYGLCCSSIFHDSYVYNGVEMVLQEKDIDFDKIRAKQILLPQWGVYISAYARREEIKQMCYIKSDGVYGDTDSWKITHPDKYVTHFKIYNDMILRKLMNTDLSKLNFEYINCSSETELKEKIKGIGFFENESKISRFKTLGCKRYIMLEDKGKGEKIVCKCAGMKSDKFLLSETGKTDDEIFKDFDFDLTLSANDSGKLAHAYNDNAHSQTVVDYLGNTETMKENSSICLFPIPFKIKDVGGYISYFVEFQKERNRRL